LFFRSPFFLNLMIFIGINTIVAVGLNLLMGYAGQVSLGQGAFYGLGAYSSGILTAKFGLPFLYSFFIAILIVAVVAFIIGLPTLRLKGYYLAMVTLGFAVIAYILFVEVNFLTGGHEGLVGIPYLSVFNLKFNTDLKYYYLVWVFDAIIIFISLNIVNSSVGRILRAIQGNELAAQMMGVNVWMRKVEIFVISAIYAGIAGTLYAHYITYLSPGAFSLEFSILILAMVVVGGMTRIWGGVWGALILTILPELLRAFKGFNTVIYGLIIMLVIIMMPGGVSEALDKVNLKFLHVVSRILLKKKNKFV